MKKIIKKGKLIAFLYRIIRDELTVGQIEFIIQEVEKNKRKDKIFKYSNPYLANYAECIIKRLLQ